jgi:transcription elongation factor Elf1
MAKKNKKHFKVEKPMIKVKVEEVEHFKCPNCRADNFQIKTKKGYEMVVECISCGEMCEIEFEEECDGECEIKE